MCPFSAWLVCPRLGRDTNVFNKTKARCGYIGED